MKVEEALKDAMASQVAGVYASPSMGQAVRRRSRRNVVRFRTAGAALLTVAVAGAVPVYLSHAPAAGHGQTAAGAGDGSADTAAVSGVVVPDVIGTDATSVRTILEDAGFTVEFKEALTEGQGLRVVTAQEPAAGTEAPAGSVITVTIVESDSPEASPSATPSADPLPQDLGDLGDGRDFGGIHVGYLPDGLEWGKWSGKDGFGKTSYTTTWVEPGLEPGMYSVQMIVYKGDAADRLADRMKGYRGQGAEAIKVGGKTAYLVPLGEAPDKITEGGTLTIVWTERTGLAVEVAISPDYAKKIGKDAAGRELKKIAEGVAPTR
ncbi:PASTA domain-containing protein [Planotetraspora sp. A-T 1434]|uniref:PASTA domain-containing protein n=1 Tax=Planotetraspora sp. A-T 1434 TaxID=2979219 RepID=UPI0021C22036|nr:PASTA domain-containing protein [Planotetraspora sp. A-T 1434]MCT9934990.1 PASTA domain-containing protein [Planotetraspora sp. A-T 1434]